MYGIILYFRNKNMPFGQKVFPLCKPIGLNEVLQTFETIKEADEAATRYEYEHEGFEAVVISLKPIPIISEVEEDGILYSIDPDNGSKSEIT